ncbi:MAG: ATP-binding protein [Bacteroidota bacterium]
MSEKQNLSILHREIDWLEKVIQQALASYLMQEGHESNWEDIALLDVSASETPYAALVRDWELDVYERLALALGLATHLRPEVLDVFLSRNKIHDQRFTEFGGIVDPMRSGFFPTVQTFLFIVCAKDRLKRSEAMRVLSSAHQFMREQVLLVADSDEFTPERSAKLTMSKMWLKYLLTAQWTDQVQEYELPISKLNTELDWEDLVLPAESRSELRSLESWVQHSETINMKWGLSKRINPGFQALFHGVPGTGKTLTASLLGKTTNREVYRVHSAGIASAYIGETEKNLSRILELAQANHWILFFDEADALFGKRTEVADAHDRYANQEVSYLLQRVENHPGLVIFAFSSKPSISESLLMRFDAIVHFPMPDDRDRLALWQKAFSGPLSLEDDTDLESIALKFELTPGQISMILKRCAIRAAQEGVLTVGEKDIMREFKRLIASH